MFDRVVDQVQERAPHRVLVPAGVAQGLIGPHAKRHPAPRRARPHQAHHRGQEVARSHFGEMRSLVQTRGREHTLDQRFEPLALFGEQRSVLAGVAPALGERLSEDADGGHGRPQLVSDAGDECLLARDGTRLRREGALDEPEGRQTCRDGEPKQPTGGAETAKGRPHGPEVRRRPSTSERDPHP